MLRLAATFIWIRSSSLQNICSNEDSDLRMKRFDKLMKVVYFPQNMFAGNFFGIKFAFHLKFLTLSCKSNCQMSKLKFTGRGTPPSLEPSYPYKKFLVFEIFIFGSKKIFVLA
jgi:hypothetical protein